jgi:hypothetical protein
MTIYDAKTSDDLEEMAQERGIRIDWDRPTWAIVDELIRDHEYAAANAGTDEEILRMACRLAVRSCDPDYRGYTPFGDIS